MITIYSDSKKIYDPRIEKLHLEEAELSQAKNKAGTLKLIIPTDHEYADLAITPGVTRVTVKEDDETLFKGRIIKNNPDFLGDTEYTAEGDLAYLNDTIIRPYEFCGSPREYFTFLITQHNAQVEKERQFVVGNITVSDPNDYVVRSNIHYPSTWEELQEKLLDKMDCFLVERWENGVTYLDCLAEIRENNEQTAKYGENVIDIDQVKEIDSGFATAVIPLGKKQEAEDGEEKYLTIESVNSGKDYVQDDDAVSKYGLVLKTIEHEDVTLPENLFRKGKEDLKEALKSVESITVTAADLSGTGVKVESFRFMKNVRCISVRHKLDFRSPIVTLDRNLLDRSDYKITVGNTLKTYTGSADAARRDTDTKIEEIINLEREARKKAIADLVDKMGKASGLYVTDIGKDGAHNWFLHDKKTLEESYTIIQVNDAGILFSSDGGNSYNGLSWDGTAILEKIYLIGLDATYIKTGKLLVSDGEGNTLFCVDMKTGEVLINNGILKVGSGFISTNGRFQLGPMSSRNGKFENGIYTNQDVYFDKAIFVDYGVELFGNNDSAAHTPYIDFHLAESIEDQQTADYTARIEQSSSNVISMYGKRQGDGDTPQSCTLNVAVVNTASDKRLKDKVQYLDEETSLAFINKLRPAAYRYGADQDEMYHYGLIYQDVEPIIKSKNCALLGKFLRWEKQPDGKSKQVEYGALGYIELISDLIGAVKALTARVEKLERNNHD